VQKLSRQYELLIRTTKAAQNTRRFEIVVRDNLFKLVTCHSEARSFRRNAAPKNLLLAHEQERFFTRRSAARSQ
jgi:hypothetical protein